jgi:hypothetical protein
MGNIGILTCSGFQLQTPISLYFSKELVEDGLFLGKRFGVCILLLRIFLFGGILFNLKVRC